MFERASSSMYWPNFRSDIINHRAACTTCTRYAPSNPAMPPTEPEYPTYPFQSICIDFFHVSPYNYVALVDRYSNWLSVFQLQKDDSDHLIKILRDYLSIFGIPTTVTTDGASVFTSKLMEEFFDKWGIVHRVSTAYHARANKRGEVGVKSAKRLIRGNVTQTGSLQTDRLARALLAHRNTPCPVSGLSPAQIVFGRVLRDFLPLQPGKFQPRREWRQAADLREAAYAKRHLKKAEQLSRGTKHLPPLHPGDCVAVQNQTGNNPRQWFKTGVVIEAGPFNSYTISIDGSRNITKRNRKFLRKITPFADLSRHRASPPLAQTTLPPTQPVQPPLTAAKPPPTLPESQTVPEAPTLQDSHNDSPVDQEVTEVGDIPGHPPDTVPVPPLRLVRQSPKERWIVAKPQQPVPEQLGNLTVAPPLQPPAPQFPHVIPMAYTTPLSPVLLPQFQYNLAPNNHVMLNHLQTNPSNPSMMNSNPLMLNSNHMMLMLNQRMY